MNILVVLNGLLTPQHVVGSAINIAKTTSSFLHAVFVDYGIDLAEYNYPFPNDLSLTRNYLTGKTIAEEHAEILKDSIKLFKDECQAAKVDFSLEADQEISILRLKELSALSDLIIADANENLRRYHIADLLIDAHCPILLASKEVNKIENIIFNYDGRFSSLYAIKMFTYLFPEWRNLSIHLIHITKDKSNELPEEKEIKSWLSRHYENIQIKILHGDIREELVNYTKSIPDSLAVMGSFGRSAMSRFFHKSLANYAIEEGKSSLFISHE